MRILINQLDVWGNEEDGFEINDVYGLVGVLEVADDCTDQDIIDALISQDFIYPGQYEIDDFFNSEYFFANLVMKHNGKPLLQLKEE